MRSQNVLRRLLVGARSYKHYPRVRVRPFGRSFSCLSERIDEVKASSVFHSGFFEPFSAKSARFPIHVDLALADASGFHDDVEAFSTFQSSGLFKGPDARMVLSSAPNQESETNFSNFCVRKQDDCDHHGRAQLRAYSSSRDSEYHTACGTRSKLELRRKYMNTWTSQEIFNWPNAISMGRLLSGPALAWLIVKHLPQPAFIGLVIAGASDWLDGYIARQKNIDSVVGTYLDPLADKVLIGCVTLAMAHVGYLPPTLVALVVARDTALVAGSFVHRAYTLKGEKRSLRDFFNLHEGKVEKIKPLLISKVNTVLQLALVGTALLQPAFCIEDIYSLVPMLSWAVAFTTCASWASYGIKILPKQVHRLKT